MAQFPVGRTRPFVCKNIGDYVQTVASMQFCDPKYDEVIEQEEADFYKSDDGRKCRLIMNGWFQWRAENWPPSDDIIPLLTSMHFSPLRQEQLLTPKGIEFLKKNAPVGCRDHYTEQLLQARGIPAYFSACVTLTLGKKYTVQDAERKGIYFVDPFIEIPTLYEEVDGKNILNVEAFNEFWDIYTNHKDIIDNLAKRPFFKDYLPTGFLDRDESIYRPYYKAACFYKTYSQKFTDELILKADYITHWLDIDMANQDTYDMIDIAEGLVKKYAKAEMVITSRIHAGLPSLGMDTPVVFVANEEVTSAAGTFNTPGRLGGLIEFFRIMKLENSRFSTEDSIFANVDKFELNTRFKNLDTWRPYADRLRQQLEAFMDSKFDMSKLSTIRSIAPVK